jgi:hypothetical protein
MEKRRYRFTTHREIEKSLSIHLDEEWNMGIWGFWRKIVHTPQQWDPNIFDQYPNVPAFHSQRLGTPNPNLDTTTAPFKRFFMRLKE